MHARWLDHLTIAPAFLFEGGLSKLLRLASDLACSPVCLRCLRILKPPSPRHWLRAVQQRLADLACNVCVCVDQKRLVLGIFLLSLHILFYF